MSKNREREVAILGGGISGLSVAWHLKKAGIPFRLFEKEKQTGGMIYSDMEAGTILDFGPNSLRDRSGEVRKLISELGLGSEVLQISEAFKTRYIVRDRALQDLKPSPISFLKSSILSGKGKMRAFAEPFKAKGTSEDESIGDFLERRIGREAVNYLVDPVFSGIYAGDIYSMSKQAVLPKLANFETEYGSLLWGAIRSKHDKPKVKPLVLSFKKGIQQLTDALTTELSESICFEKVKGIQSSGQGYELQTEEQTYSCSAIISCLPSYALAELFEPLYPEANRTLKEIDYAPMLSTQVIYEGDEVGELPTGFGFLVPRKENIRLLGAIWKSEIFPELSEKGKRHFTLMTGGAHDPGVSDQPTDQVESEILAEFNELMGISKEPVTVRSKLWEKAIPQFKVGYNERIQQKIDQFESAHPGFYVGGNFRWGVSVPDCVEGARKLVDSWNS